MANETETRETKSNRELLNEEIVCEKLIKDWEIVNERKRNEHTKMK